jgi:hypothetical protein
MSAWVALIYLCVDVSGSCTLIGSTQLFFKEEACIHEMVQVGISYEAQGFIVDGYCHRVVVDPMA